MIRRVFYSWQSDIKGAANRNLIQHSLEAAAKKIAADDSVAVEPRIDRDTLDLPGSPDISAAIFHKISHSHVFVADISIINSSYGGRKTPNPNVLIELGYALHCLGHERVILVFNTAFGKPEELPFDLRSKRIMTYYSAENAVERAATRKELESKFNNALRDALLMLPDGELTSPYISVLITAIENQSNNRIIMLRRFLKTILEKLSGLEPPTIHNGGTLDHLLAAIEKSEPLILEFAAVANTAVVIKDVTLIEEIYKWFGSVIERYRVADSGGITFDGDYDFFRFAGHEMLTSLFGFLLADEQYTIIQRLLQKTITVKYLLEENGPADVNYYYGSEWAYLLKEESERRGITSLHANLLKDRHQNGRLAELIPMRDFAAADFFLYLYNKISKLDHSRFGHGWKPWSIVFLKEPPVFLKKTEQEVFASQMVAFFNLNTIEELKHEIESHTLKVRSFYYRVTLDLFLRSFMFNKIGTLK
ncbi:hypothetical protein D0C36_20030 [Mucilaginibacter conchicola]|uniref:CD-NTase-associated protein 12/Pycsar effector protein TIR domain-containing protein n=1 Tax=Mucilaginibacter conchicola TaxID=2303333 RepID=A0A372NRK4_9SPHI|nr:hypothetical protein [Mucilaginibacter conchicola]RFZ91227.1 hypothetical protein D0C36_20030 [Mucilaginibacter conchicola]